MMMNFIISWDASVNFSSIIIEAFFDFLTIMEIILYAYNYMTASCAVYIK